MRVRVGEERLDGGLAKRVVLAGGDLGKVDEGDVLLLRDLTGPSTAAGGVADDLAVFPRLARDGRAADGDGTPGLRFGDVFAQIPAVGVDGLVKS